MTDIAPRPEENRYEIIRQFRAGMVCAISVSSVPEEHSSHWVAGWRDGKVAAAEHGNAYLISIGLEPMGVIKLAESEKGSHAQAAAIEKGGG